MRAYWLKRLLWIIPTLWGITLITFFIMRLSPGSPIELKRFSEKAKNVIVDAEKLKAMRQRYGLEADLPGWYQNFIDRVDQKWFAESPAQHSRFKRASEWIGKTWIQYWVWVGKIVTFDFGESFKDNRLVLDKIKEVLPVTLLLNLLEVVIAYFISVPLGVFSALRHQSIADKALMVKLFILYSLPVFWVATMLRMALATDAGFDWFPLNGLLSDGIEHFPWYQQLGDFLWHLVLPVICMVYGSFAYLSRFSRGTFLEVIRQDFIRTAKAKGLSHRQVIWKHAFRNVLIPQITLLGTLLPALISGSVIIEQIFSIEGMGKLAFESVAARDYPTVLGVTFISALLTLVSLLLADFLTTRADPRVSFEKV